MEGAARQTEGSAGGFTVTVWHAPDCPPPPKLVGALSSKGIALVRVQSAFRALAELCRHGRRGGGDAPALIVVHPETLSLVVPLWEAKSRYAPGARLWMYGPASDPKLRAIVDADIAAWGPKPVVMPRAAPASNRATGPASAPKLKLAGEGEIPPEAPGGEDGAKLSLLTPEELRMLLGEDEPPAVRER